MSRTLKLVKLFLKNNFKKDGKKNKGTIAAIIVCAVVFLPMVALACFMISLIAGEAMRVGVHKELLSVLVTGSVLPVLIFGIISMLNVVIFARDNDFLSSLPVRRSEIFLAKLFVVYLDELLVCAAMFLPTCITFGVTVGAGPLFYVFMPLVLLVMPVFPLLICTLLVFPIMYIVAFFRRHTALAAVLMIIFFGGVMAAYFKLVSGMPTEDEEMISIVLTPQLIGLMKGVWQYFVPARFAVGLMLGADWVLQGVLFLLCSALALGAAVAVAVPLYRRAGTLQSEVRAKGHGKAVNQQQSSAVKAMIIKDFKQLIRFPAFAFQSFAGVIMVPLITAILPGMMVGEIQTDVDMIIPSAMSVGMIMFYGLMLLSGTNYVASAAFTREGDTFYYNKILPVAPRDIMRAKLIFADIVTAVGTVLTAISAVAFAGVGVLEGLGIALCFMTFGMAMNAFGIKRDLARPKLVWSNVNEALKNNFYMTVPMFIGMGVGFVLLILAIMMTIFASVIGVVLADVIFWSVSIVACVICAVLFRAGYYKNCEEKFERIEP